MGATYSYPNGPKACEGVIGSCPKITSPLDHQLIILYSFWAVSFIIFIIFYFYRRNSFFKNIKNSEVVRVSQISSIDSYRETISTSVHDKNKIITNNHKYNYNNKKKNNHSKDLEKQSNIQHKLLLDEYKYSEEEGTQNEEDGRQGRGGGDEIKDIEIIYDQTSPSTILQLPFKVNTFGTLCYYLMNLISMSWIFIFLVIIVDVYLDCQFEGIDNLCNYGTWPIFGDYDTNAEYFFVVWILSTLWYLAIVVFRDQIRGWFMLPCLMSEATHMYIWSRDIITSDSEILFEEVSIFVKWIRKLRVIVTPKHLRDGHETIVQINSNSADNSRFFIHETKIKKIIY